MNSPDRETERQRDRQTDREYSKTIFVGSLYDKGPGFAGAVFSVKGLCPTLTTMQGGERQPHIIVSRR